MKKQIVLVFLLFALMLVGCGGSGEVHPYDFSLLKKFVGPGLGLLGLCVGVSLTKLFRQRVLDLRDSVP